MNEITVYRGRPMPMGASRAPNGVNFVVISRHASAMTLVVYPESGGKIPLAEFKLDARKNRTGDHWHIRIEGLPECFCYGWLVDGPPGVVHRFKPDRLLVDPFSTVLSNGYQFAGTCEVDPERTSRKSLFTNRPSYDWGEDAPLHAPVEDAIIYELHVRGFTRHANSGVAHPGTYRGLVEKIPYLQWLGITAVELLPIMEFDECDCPFSNPITGDKLVNFWGYNTIGFAAPKSAFAADGKAHGQDDEFREMVKAFHAAGIEVYLDVVYNHTGEGDDRGRTYHFRGLDNDLYYLMDDRGNYRNYSGVGNTVNCNHPVVREFIITNLRYWVTDMHVDGFRFDLASVLGRDRNGNIMADPPIVESIADDSILASVKLIAEPWDAGGAYHVGGFPHGKRWAEWNDRYRDDIRRFWRGDKGYVGLLASRITGSSDIYGPGQRGPRHTVNFVTCHDGFTLNDVVSYNEKHNLANGEGNRDGSNDNCSWNGGVEGETRDLKVIRLRERRAKSLMATLMISQGVPMILAGDEFLRTQRGNNNAWCQDNELSWVDWSCQTSNAGFLRFVRELIWLRRRHPVFRRSTFLRGELSMLTADIRWHGERPLQPDFGMDSRAIAFTLDGRYHGREGGSDNDFYVALNGSPSIAKFEIPIAPSGRRWRMLIDTSADSPNDFFPEGSGAVVMPGATVSVPEFGTLMLVSDS